VTFVIYLKIHFLRNLTDGLTNKINEKHQNIDITFRAFDAFVQSHLK